MSEREPVRVPEEVLEGLEAVHRHAGEDVLDIATVQETPLENYAALAPEALNSLTPEERHHLYKILKLRVEIDLDGSLAVGGMLVDHLTIYKTEALS